MEYQKITELTKPPTVGQSYLVPCVTVNKRCFLGDGAILPVLGEFHSDKEIIGFPYEHLHLDARFISRYEYGLFKTWVQSPLFFIIQKSSIKSETWEVMRCNRRMPNYPGCSMKRSEIPWMEKLEEAYRDKQLNCGKCPHKGIDLRQVNADRQGNKTCPGHGLIWDKQGNLVVKDGKTK